jgi:hypothetical protein
MHGAGRPASKRASSSPGRRPLVLPPVRWDGQQQQNQQQQPQPPVPRPGPLPLAAYRMGDETVTDRHLSVCARAPPCVTSRAGAVARKTCRT